VTLTPTARWSGQISIGRINNREVLHPIRDTLRSSASVTYARPLSGGHWAASLIWGRNHDLAYTQPPTLPPSGRVIALQTSAVRDRPPIRPQHFVSIPTRVPGQIYNSYLLESTALIANKHWFWGRVENTDKDSLLLFEEAPFALLVDERRFARIQAYTAGYERELPRIASWLSQGVGAQVTVFAAPRELSPVYGSHPIGVQVFLRFRVRSPD
jgi:hypothetical protein